MVTLHYGNRSVKTGCCLALNVQWIPFLISDLEVTFARVPFDSYPGIAGRRILWT